MKELGLRGNCTATPEIYETCIDKTYCQLINSQIVALF